MRHAEQKYPLFIGVRDGKPVHISEAKRGKDESVRCPHCGDILVGKTKGDRKIPHFAHYAKDSNLACHESALHIAAKHAIQESRTLWLPEVWNNGEQIKPSQVVVFDKVEIEERVGRYKADCVGYCESYGRVLIEIKVTHETEGDKLAFMRKSKERVLEVEVSVDEIQAEDWKSSLIDGLRTYRIPRHWLCFEEYDLSRTYTGLKGTDDNIQTWFKQKRAKEEESNSDLFTFKRQAMATPTPNKPLSLFEPKKKNDLGAYEGDDDRYFEWDTRLPEKCVEWITENASDERNKLHMRHHIQNNYERIKPAWAKGFAFGARKDFTGNQIQNILLGDSTLSHCFRRILNCGRIMLPFAQMKNGHFMNTQEFAITGIYLYPKIYRNMEFVLWVDLLNLGPVGMCFLKPGVEASSLQHGGRMERYLIAYSGERLEGESEEAFIEDALWQNPERAQWVRFSDGM